ncbi:unnamed protein product [Adineta ricciae]|uniref:Uncharacterized protein n=1 Tax=Adineta ricciae TaxID=249248 RepID=A0A813WAK4_ADIRI|nr:unnamed protein product [Adineta ricciae]CAF0848031.1 unnamed protein product [Adineta ricciae]
MNNHRKNRSSQNERSNTTPTFHPVFNFSSLYNRQYYQSSISFQRLLTSSNRAVADLAEPLSIFDEIEVSKHRRSLNVSPIPSQSDRLPLLNSVHRDRAEGFRQQLLIDIQHSIHDIEEDLTSFERQSLTSRLSSLRKPNDYNNNLALRTRLPPIFRTVHEQMQLLDDDDRILFPRQSTADEPLSNIPLPNHVVHNKSPSDIDIGYFLNDSENIYSKPTFDEFEEEEAILQESMNADQYLHDLTVPSHNCSIFIDSEPVNSNQVEFLEATINLVPTDHVDQDIDDLMRTTFLYQVTPRDKSNTDNIRSEVSLESQFTSPVPSQGTIRFQDSYPDVPADVVSQNNHTIPRPPTRNSILITEDPPEKLPALQPTSIDSRVASPADKKGLFAVHALIESEFRHDRNRSTKSVSSHIENGNRSDSSSVTYFSTNARQQEQQRNHPSSIPSTTGKNTRHVNTEKKEEIKRKKIDVTKKSIVTTISILPSSSSSPLKQVLPTSIIDNVQTQFTFENNRNNNNYNGKPSNTALNKNAVHLSIEGQEERFYNSHNYPPTSSSLVLQMHSRIQTTTLENDKDDTYSPSPAGHTRSSDFNDNGSHTPERDHSINGLVSRATSSAHSSSKSNRSKKSVSRHASSVENDRPHTSPDSVQKTPTNENEENLDDEPQSLHEFDQRSLSDRSISQRSESGLSSSANSALPVNTDGSDFEDNEIPKLYISSSKKKNLSPSKGPPSERESPRASVNEIHSERISSRASYKASVPVDREPEHALPSRPLQTKVHSPVAFVPKHNGLLHEVEQKSQNQSSSMSQKNNTSASNNKQEQLLRPAPSSSESKHEQKSARQSPSTSSPMHSDERITKEQITSMSHPVKDAKPHHQALQHMHAQIESNNSARSPSTTPHHSKVQDNNHTSMDNHSTSSLTLPNEQMHTSNNDHHIKTKQASTLSPIQPAFATEIHRRPSSDKSRLSSRSQHEQKPPINDHSSSFPRIEARSPSPDGHVDDEDQLEPKSDERQRRRRVSFSDSHSHLFVDEQQVDPNWRERVASILASKHQPNEKYAYVQARVNSFENFDYHPKKINTIPKKTPRAKHSDSEEEKSFEQNHHKMKRPELFIHEQIGDEQRVHSIKEMPVQMFGRLMFLADGSPTIFHEPLEWHASSKLKDYLYENFHHTPRRNEFKVYNKKPRWHSESKLSEVLKESPRFYQRDALVPASSLPLIPGTDQSYFYQQQFDKRLQHHFPNSHPKRSISPISSEKPEHSGESKALQKRQEKPPYQVYEKVPQWNSVSKSRIPPPPKIHPSRTTLSNGQIFNEKLNWNARAKVHCWSELDLRKLDRKKALVTYPIPKRNYRMLSPIHPSKESKSLRMIADRPARPRDSRLKDYIWENHKYKSHRKNDKTPPRKPKWNAVSKTRSLNTVYNPKIKHNDSIRRGWDRESRRKRVNKLPPLKRKKEQEELPQLPSNDQLAIDYSYDRSPTTQAHANRSEYGMASSRRSSKALVPINHRQRFPDLELPNDLTPRSHRPIQQEWYDEATKSRLTHRMDGEASTNQSFLHSVTPVYQSNTPRDLLPYRSTPRNSQNSGVSGTLLDSSIRTNRATEIRLSKDMDEHHQHCHHVNQSMPLEIRGFELEGTQCTVPVDATIRPLSNVNYRTSERVKNHRLYPWSMLHGPGTSSRNSSLLPIAEFRRPSLDTTITETQHS